MDKMSQPISSWGASITEHYPDPSKWPVFDLAHKSDVFRFASLWVLEGIPYAFRSKPMAFEYLRERLATKLGIDARDIGLTGSGRCGFSLSPGKFGKGYTEQESDLDFFIVSNDWFQRLSNDFESFLARYNAGLAKPENSNEEKYFKENSQRVPNNIKRGFIDQHKIPNKDRYENVRELSGIAYWFGQEIGRLTRRPEKIRVSFRAYKDWQSARSQIGGSLVSALSKRPMD